ncbi:MAG: hypothetical protein JW969_09580 [Spirochaetales bacterium]|nr:hypothetical protein [Spirochaetales bacterium]
MDTLTNTPTSIPTNTPGIGHIYLTVIGNDDIGGTGNGWILFDPVLINGISRIDARYGIYEYDLFYSNSHSVLLHAYTDGRAFLDHWKYNGIQTRNNPVEVEVGTTIEVMFLAPDPTPTPTLSPRN